MFYFIPTYCFNAKFKGSIEESEIDSGCIRLCEAYNSIVESSNLKIKYFNNVIENQMKILMGDIVVCFDIVDRLPGVFENHYNPWFEPDEINEVTSNGIPSIYPIRLFKAGITFSILLNANEYKGYIPIIDKFMDPGKWAREECVKTLQSQPDSKDEFLLYTECFGRRIKEKLNQAYNIISNVSI